MINFLYNYSFYFIDKQNMIPVCVSPNGLDYIHKNIYNSQGTNEN